MGAEDALLGSEVGNFRLARLLGRGGMGRVYLGVHESIGSRVAIKVLAEDLVGSEEILERFFTEARAVNLIAHENIVAITDLDRLPNGRPYIVMEFIDGKTLRDLLQASPGLPLPVGGVVRAAIDVLHALEAAHAAGIVHRDLKPDNVILTASGRAKVLDFGIAKLLEGPALRTATGIMLGTPHYMAPEQILGTEADGRTDLYALGVMMFELLTGARPFDAPTEFALMQAQVQTPAPAVDTVPPVIAAIVAKALAKAPAERWESARAMADALASALEALDEDAAPPFPAAALKPSTPHTLPASSTDRATVAESPRAASGPRSAATRVDSPVTPVPITRASTTPPPVAAASRLGLVIGAIGVIALVVAIVLVLQGRRDPTAMVAAVPSPPSTPVVVATPDAAMATDAEAPALDATIGELAQVLDAGPGVLDAGAKVSHPVGATAHGTSVGKTCNQGADCANYNCDCAGQFYIAQSCVERKCVAPGAVCPARCEPTGSPWTGGYTVFNPQTTGDCGAAVTGCKVRGDCNRRWMPDGGAYQCTKDCAHSTMCHNDGLCVEAPNERCVASDASCAAMGVCKWEGQCGANATLTGCVHTEAGCQASDRCKSLGECGLENDKCVVSSDHDCRASTDCKDQGSCWRNAASDPGQHAYCAAKTEEDCKQSIGCTSTARCTLGPNGCVATVESCKQLSWCKDCTVVEGVCRQAQ